MGSPFAIGRIVPGICYGPNVRWMGAKRVSGKLSFVGSFEGALAWLFLWEACRSWVKYWVVAFGENENGFVSLGEPFFGREAVLDNPCDPSLKCQSCALNILKENY